MLSKYLKIFLLCTVVLNFVAACAPGIEKLPPTQPAPDPVPETTVPAPEPTQPIPSQEVTPEETPKSEPKE